MQKFEWNSSFETKIEIIDAQHKNLFVHIDALALALYSGGSMHELSDLMMFLESYVNEHFRDEEKMMFENEYPEYFEHKAAHKLFTTIYGDLKKDLVRSGTDSYLAIRVEKEIRTWWENHIIKMDMKYVPFILKSIPPSP